MSARAPAVRVSLSWPMLIGLVVLLGVGGAVGAWHLRVQGLDGELDAKRKVLKNLHLGGRLPPNREVMAYLTARTEALDAQYRDALAWIGTAPTALAGRDPQLLFQERVHEVQSTLARLTTARGLEVPTLLGLPKELPPADVAPRFLLQLDLAQELADLVLSVREVTALESLKVEDLEIVESGIAEHPSFLTRLPVRVRFVGTLRGVTKVLALIDHAKPIIDVASLRVAAPKEPEPAPASGGRSTIGIILPTSPKPADATKPAEPSAPPAPAASQPATLDVDLVVARYLITAAQLPADEADADKSRRKKSE